MLVRGYLRGAAWLYGSVRLSDLYELFLRHNGPILSEEAFCALARKVQGPDEWFRIIGDDDIYDADASVSDVDRWVVHRQYCYATWDSLFTLERNHRGKPVHPFSRAKLLSYQEPTYIPDTPQICHLAQLLKGYSQGAVPHRQILQQAVLLARDDRDAVYFLEQMQRLGCRFDSWKDRMQVAQCYKRVYDSVPKPIHNGYSDQQLRTQPNMPNPLRRYFLWFCGPWEEDRFYRNIRKKPGQVQVTGITEYQRFLDRCRQGQTLPPRLFDHCPCGSGLYYADCCGKR